MKYRNPSKKELVKILKRKLQENDRKGFNEISKLYNKNAKKEAKEKAKNELYRKQVIINKVKKAVTPGKQFKKDFKRYLKQKTKSKAILRNQRATVVIKEIKQQPSRSYYFSNEYDKEKRSLFLK